MYTRQTIKLIIVSGFLLCLFGCAGITAPRPVVDTPLTRNTSGQYAGAIPQGEGYGQPTAQVAQGNDGSLFSQPAAAQWSPWRDDTAHRVGDIVTVRIAVNNQAEKSASTDLNRTSKLDAGISYFFGYEDSIPGALASTSGTSGSAASSNSNSSADLIKTQSSSSFQGDGDTQRMGRMTADVSAIVTDVFPNGNMTIHGSQALLINNESSLLTVDGIIRPSDIGISNIVDSDRIANARIEVTGRGVISDKQRPGFLMRVFDWVWPL